MVTITGGGLSLPIVGNGATVTASTPLLDLSQTWNNGAVVFTGLKLNVTDTASDAASLLLALQVAAANKFTVDKAGTATAITLAASSNILVASNGGSIRLGSAADVQLFRDAANTLAQRNGTTAQAFNIYNTFTDASNYERGSLTWSTNSFLIYSTALGTGTQRDIRIGGSEIYFTVPGVSTRWKIDTSGNFIAGADNTYDIGASGATRPRNLFIGGTFTLGGTGTVLLATTTACANGAAAQLGTLTNAPAAGNPTKWVPINDNGTTRYIPCW